MFRLWSAFAVLMLATTSLIAEDKPLRDLIDVEMKKGWGEQKLSPAEKSTDAAFLRRIYLDTVGVIPTYDETKAFLEDADPQKRGKLIEKLLEDPRFAANQADVWDLVLFGRNPPNGDATRTRENFKKWLTDKFTKNTPYDQWVKALLLAEEEHSALFYVQYRNQPEETTVAVSRIFLGTQLQCARCHDHPFEKWTQRDFFGMAAFFARLTVVDGGGAVGKKTYYIGEKNTGEVLFTGAAKDQKPGQKGEPIKPKFLLGDLLQEPPAPKDAKDTKEPEPKAGQAPPKPAFSRKDKLAEWVTTSENHYFTRAGVNRIWAQFMGRGLVFPVDDLRDKNLPSHPELFKALTEQFAARKYDMKWLIREIVSSNAYQLACKGTATDALPEWFERGRVRPLSAEELVSAWRVATGYDAGTDKNAEKLPSGMNEYVVRYFGEPTNGQGHFQGSLSEHLFLNNSSHLRQMIQARKGNLADTLLKSRDSNEQKVERMFLSVLNRKPTPKEQEKFSAHLATTGAKPENLLEEAIWSLLNSSEFRFNH